MATGSVAQFLKEKKNLRPACMSALFPPTQEPGCESIKCGTLITGEVGTAFEPIECMGVMFKVYGDMHGQFQPLLTDYMIDV